MAEMAQLQDSGAQREIRADAEQNVDQDPTPQRGADGVDDVLDLFHWGCPG
jgi:hypothetical protein